MPDVLQPAARENGIAGCRPFLNPGARIPRICGQSHAITPGDSGEVHHEVQTYTRRCRLVGSRL